MIHTFNRVGVQRLLDHTTAAAKHYLLYEDPETAKPGLWLVGDHGVYLMSNGNPSLLRDVANDEVVTDDTPPPTFVVFADEVNPELLEFDVWWDAKRAGFGGDDGVEYLPADTLADALKTYTAEAHLQLEISTKGISVVTYAPRKKARKSAQKI